MKGQWLADREGDAWVVFAREHRDKAGVDRVDMWSTESVMGLYDPEWVCAQGGPFLVRRHSFRVASLHKVPSAYGRLAWDKLSYQDRARHRFAFGKYGLRPRVRPSLQYALPDEPRRIGLYAPERWRASFTDWWAGWGPTLSWLRTSEQTWYDRCGRPKGLRSVQRFLP